jgi:hypothetical protein
MTGMVDLRAGYGSREFGKAELQLTRNGANVLHLEKEADNRAKHWGAPTRTLHVGSGQRLPAGRILLPTRKQWAAWGGAAAVGTAGLGGVNRLNRRKKVAKRNDDRRRTAASVGLGAAGGVGVTDVTNRVGGWATREGIKYHEQLVNAGKIKHPMSRKGRDNRLKAHKAEHGVGSNVNDAPQSYYRNWPKELPGARARQFMGVKNTPKVVAATLTAGGLVGGAYGAHRSRIRKSYLPRAGGWVKASEVPKSRLRAGANSRYAARVRESDQTERERTHINRTVNAVRGLSNKTPTVMPKATVHRVGSLNMFLSSGGADAFAAKTGGPRSKGHVFVTRDTPKHIVAHEHAHLSPSRRSSYRMAQIGMNPSKRMREEARADYHSGRHYADTPQADDSGYMKAARNQKRLAEMSARGGMLSSLNCKSVSQYRLVQNRMRAADTKVGKAIKVTVNGPRPRLKGMPGMRMGGLASGYHVDTHGAYGFEVDEAYRRAGFRNSAGKLRTLGDKELRNAVESTRLRRRSTFAGNYGRHQISKVDTTMSDAEAHRLAQRYDTRGPLPKGLSREQKMKAYEGRYIASGGRKAEKWKRRATTAEVGRNVGLAGATAGAAVTLAARSRRFGPALRKVKVTAHRADNATIGAAALGGASELYGEHARSRRASYQNSPGGVAGSALSRMQAYTPEKRKP